MTAWLRSESVPGLDLEVFYRWYDTQQPGDLGVDLRARVIPGGRSNLTYEVTDGTTSRIVRRPPLGHVQPTAHDMAREFRVMAALAASEVPVPRAFAFCSDPEMFGAELYVMDRVEGTPLRTAAELEAIGAEPTDRLASAMIDVLARLHAVDPRAVGLEDLGRPVGFLSRQVRRWGRQLQGSKTRELPDADTLLARLTEQAPDADTVADTALVHGDYRLDNLLCLPEQRHPIQAVVDWEMATLGDALTDVALLLVYDQLGRMPGTLTANDVSRAPGYPSVELQLARYAGASGRELPCMKFHFGLAHLKLAAISEGVHFRYLNGHTVGDGFDTIGGAVEPLLAAGLAALRGC